MNIENVRRIWKKAMPFAFAAVIAGTAGTALAQKYLGADCCSEGAACCKPGASCCNGKHKVAQR